MANIKINVASFANAIALKNAIAREIKLGGINVDALKGKNVAEIAKLDVAPFINIIAAIDSSKEVNEAIMACLERSTYNSEKITPDTFDEVSAREDYYPIVAECLKVNLAPFLKGLASYFNTKLNASKVPSA